MAGWKLRRIAECFTCISWTSPWYRPLALTACASTKNESRALLRNSIPQPFHLDAAAAQHTTFRGLAASGWHTAAVTMRLLVESEFRPSGGVLGTGFDEIRWPRPVRPRDELRIESEVLEVRPSKSHPDLGLIKLPTTTLNQNGEPVRSPSETCWFHAVRYKQGIGIHGVGVAAVIGVRALRAVDEV